MSWDNKYNSSFYENVDIDTFKDFALKGGISEGIDLKKIYHYIENAKSLLDVGAGYGRAIDFLFRKNFKGKITAVERSKNLFDHMQSNYGNSINLIHSDIEDLCTEIKFDAVLWLWSNISEWPKHRQKEVVNILKALLTKNGILILEIIDSSQKPLNSDNYNNQHYSAFTTYGNVKGYNPTSLEVEKYIDSLNMNLIKKIPYVTETNRKREIFVITL